MAEPASVRRSLWQPLLEGRPHGVRATARRLLLFALIGLIAGLGAILFHAMTELGSHFFLDYLAGYRPVPPSGEQPLLPHTHTPFNRWILLFLPALGGIVSGFLVYTFAPEAEGHGTDGAIDAYHNKGGIIRGRVPIIKTFASSITLATGGSGGREGPIAQIGAGFGSFLATRLKLSEKERRIMLAAGLGAGVGSIFRAPLAGAIFAAEVLYSESDFESEVLIPAGIASVVGYCTFCLVFGWGTLFSAPTFAFRNPLELGPYFVLALVLCLAAYIYVKVFYGVTGLFKKLQIPNHVKPAIGGLLTGCIGFFLPQTLGSGYGVVEQGLTGSATLTFLLLVAGGKILTTSFSIGSGGSGGVFGPSVVIGGALGGAVGLFFESLFPGLIGSPGAFVLVGMAGFFTAVSATPVSTIIFVSEMTNSYHLLLPSLMVCFLCHLLSRGVSIYEEQYPDKFASPAHRGELFVDILNRYTVRDLADKLHQVSVVPEEMDFARFKSLIAETEQHYFPVVDKQNHLTGIFSLSDLRCILFEPQLEHLILVKDIAHGSIISTTPSEDLNTVFKKFTLRNIEQIPVVKENDPTVLIGMLGRREVIALYNRAVAEVYGETGSSAGSVTHVGSVAEIADDDPDACGLDPFAMPEKEEGKR